MRRTPVLVAAAAAIAVVAGVSAAVTSCSQTPTNIPVRTFQQATKMDVVCLRVNDLAGNAVQATNCTSEAECLLPVDRDTCTIVAPGANGAAQEYHLYAVVIQSTPGEVAAVDLTNGNVVDEDHATPGINFIPVGAVPTDVAVPRAGTMTFVSSADPNKPAIYAIDNRRVLGDSTGQKPLRPLTIADLPACSLPQPPGALAIAQLTPESYVLLVQLRGWGGLPAQVVAIDPGPLMRGAGIETDAGATVDGGSTGVVRPGSLAPCTALGGVTLSGALPPSWMPAPPWPDGVPYVQQGAPAMALPEAGGDAPAGEAGVLEGGTDGGMMGAGGDAAPMQGELEGGGVVIPADAEPPPVPPGGQCVGSVYVPDGGIPLTPPLGVQGPSPSAMTMRIDRPILYVADGALPLIHVIDVADPTHPVEQQPLLATSLRSPGKPIGVGPLAVSPATRDGTVYLYATDMSDGTLMVFDVTDPASTVRTPLLRPHPELNPFQPLDRIAFSAPVASVIFVEHDWQLPSQAPGDVNHIYGGILCNPNPGAHPSIDPKNWAKGAYYRADQAGTIVTNGTVEGFPERLRGIFAFATLSNGNVVAVDVDDWDAPCRRPDPMVVGNITGLLDVAQDAGAPEGGEYHAPNTFQGADAGFAGSAAVTIESFFPVSAPHRTRSNFLLENDPNTGNHAPNLVSPPTLTDVNGASIQTGPQNPGNPLIQPTALPPGWVDPTTLQNPTQADPSRASIMATPGLPGVRLSLDDPTAHIDQDWTVTFEGVIPNAEQVEADVSTDDGFQSLTLSTGTGAAVDASGPANGLTTPGYCSLGIEDWTIGQSRAEAIQAKNPADAWTSDYVEITDDLLGEDDSYWKNQSQCWMGTPLENASAQDRFNACSTRFGAHGTDAGATGVGILADTYLSRDFPIVHAYDDHLVLGRFGWDPKLPAEDTTSRVVVGPDTSNVPFLKIAQCCFHNQIGFKVRTGGEWVTAGTNGLNLLHHVRVAGDGTCVLSCDQQDALLNGRLLDTPPTWLNTPPLNLTSCPGADAGAGAGGGTQAPQRNDFDAMWNPMFSFYMKAACGKRPDGAHTLTARDLQWHFSVRGGFIPLILSITQGANVAVSPRSMFFIEPLSRLAVIDGEQQGLVVFDLYTLQFAEGPFY